MRKNRIFIVILIAILLIGSVNVNAADTKRDIKIWIEENFILGENKAFVENGHTFIPLRYIAEELKYEVNWNNELKMAEISSDEKTLAFKADSNTAILNGENIKLNEKVILRNATTYVPLRSVAELFENQVDYISSLKIATIGLGFEEDKYYPVSYHSVNEAHKELDIKINYRNTEIENKKTFNNEFELNEFIRNTEREKKGIKFHSNVDEKDKLIDYRYISPSISDPLVGSWFGITKTMGTEDYYKEYAYITKKSGNNYEIKHRSLKDNGSELITVSNFTYDPNTKILNAQISHDTLVATGDFTEGIWVKWEVQYKLEKDNFIRSLRDPHIILERY